jgi:hypothetical protein
LDDLRLLESIHSGLTWAPALTPLVQDGMSTIPAKYWAICEQVGSTPVNRMIAYLVWLINIDVQVAMAIAERLNFPRALRESLRSGGLFLGELPNLVQAPPSVIVERFSHVPRMALYAIHKRKMGEMGRLIEQYINIWDAVRPYTNGDDLLARGLKPGRDFSRILDTLKAAWLDGEINNREQEEALLGSLISSIQQNGK